MSSLYILTGNRKGETVRLQDRYQFVNGVLTTDSEEHADLIQPMMEFYAAKRVSVEEYEAAMAAKSEAAKSEAAPAKTESTKK